MGGEITRRTLTRLVCHNAALDYCITGNRSDRSIAAARQTGVWWVRQFRSSSTAT